MVSLRCLRKQACVLAVWGRLILWLPLGPGFSGDGWVECLSAEPCRWQAGLKAEKHSLGNFPPACCFSLLEENRIGS